MILYSCLIVLRPPKSRHQSRLIATLVGSKTVLVLLVVDTPRRGRATISPETEKQAQDNNPDDHVDDNCGFNSGVEARRVGRRIAVVGAHIVGMVEPRVGHALGFAGAGVERGFGRLEIMGLIANSCGVHIS